MTTTKNDTPIDAASFRARYITNMKALAQELIDHVESHLASDEIITDPYWTKIDNEDRISLRFDLRDMLGDDRGCCEIIRSYVRDHFNSLGYMTVFTTNSLNLQTQEVEHDLT